MKATAAAAVEKLFFARQPAIMAIQAAHPADDNMTDHLRPILSI